MRTLYLMMLVVVAMQPDVHAKNEAELVGTYVCRGENPDGRPYKGIVDIIQRGAVLHLRWTIAEGQMAYGIGLRDGKKLYVSYAVGDDLGVSVYEITKKELKGQWAIAGATRTFPETLTKVIGTLPSVRPPDHPPPAARPLPRADPSTILES